MKYKLLPRGNSIAISNTQIKDTEALHGPPDRESNFGKDKATRKTQTTNKKTKTGK